MKNLLFLMMLCPVWLLGQVFFDDFSDGNFTSSPEWSGDTQYFIVNASNRLQSMGLPQTDTIFLSTPVSTKDSTVWRFNMLLDFPPSTTNFVRVYLASDQADLKNPLNGYYIYVGESGNNDAVELYRQTGHTRTLVMRGLDATVGGNSNNLGIQVIRNSTGNWQLWVDPSGGNNYVLEATGFDNQVSIGQYMGVYCRFTSTRFDKFSFDSFYVAPLYVDTDPPVLLSAQAVDASSVVLQFNEPLDSATAAQVSNYSINNGVGNPLQAVFSPTASSQVTLILGSNLQSGTNYLVTASNIEDLAGNVSGSQQAGFSWFVPNTGSVIINEIMADETPQVGLPLVEWVEFFNTTGTDINLNGWTWSDPSSTATLGNILIPADSFIILTRNASVDSFASYGIQALVYGLSIWPTLNNSGDLLTLSDPDGNIVDLVDYIDSWYKDAVKKNGGWTLERIDPFTPCSSADNWAASIHPSGGTPGRTNSIFGLLNDTVRPIVNGVSIIGQNQVQVNFSKALDSLSAANPSNYSINNGIGNPSSVLVMPGLKEVVLTISTLDPDLLYTLTFGAIADCFGNLLATNSVQLAIPKNPLPFDVLITEIMADPEPPVGLPNQEYVELYNASNKTFDLAGWQFADDSRSEILGSFLLLPGAYVILTSSSASSEFVPFGPVTTVSSLPSLNNSGDRLSLSDPAGNVIHFVNYSDTWYNSNLKKNGGWSLEMRDTENPCSGASNWSASNDPAGGTPGRTNSIEGPNPDESAPVLIRAVYLAPQHIQLVFDEPMDIDLASDEGNYNITPNIGKPVFASCVPPNSHIVELLLPQPLIEGIIYTVKVQNLTDCVGNLIGLLDTARLGIPQEMDTGDLVINELLFNVPTGGSNFVELYNISGKILNLQDLFLTSYNSFGEFGTVYEVAPDGFLVFPGDHVVLTRSPDFVKTTFFVPHIEKLVPMSGFPSLPNASGSIVALHKTEKIIDQFFYQESFHNALLDDKKGITLERIDYQRPTQDESNWQSAATQLKATPTYRNSQFRATNIPGELVIDPPVFSPDGDGFDDFVNIGYKLDKSGYVGSITIFDDKGRRIKRLVRNEVFGTEGVFKWDGTTDENQKARIGAYIVYVEIFTPEGDTKRLKKTVILAGRL